VLDIHKIKMLCKKPFTPVTIMLIPRSRASVERDESKVVELQAKKK
jgi:hypothetical protein